MKALIAYIVINLVLGTLAVGIPAFVLLTLINVDNHPSMMYVFGAAFGLTALFFIGKEMRQLWAMLWRPRNSH